MEGKEWKKDSLRESKAQILQTFSPPHTRPITPQMRRACRMVSFDKLQKVLDITIVFIAANNKGLFCFRRLLLIALLLEATVLISQYKRLNFPYDT